jgi:hypothetical protein
MGDDSDNFILVSSVDAVDLIVESLPAKFIFPIKPSLALEGKGLSSEDSLPANESSSTEMILSVDGFLLLERSRLVERSAETVGLFFDIASLLMTGLDFSNFTSAGVRFPAEETSFGSCNEVSRTTVEIRVVNSSCSKQRY